MGPNSIQSGGSASVNYANEPTVVDVSIPAPQAQNPQQLEDLLQAMDALDGARNRSATQGVPAPDTEGDTKVDATGMQASLDGAEANVSTDVFAFMALFTQMAQQMRKVAKEQRQTELQNQVSSINSAADKMVDAAEKRFAAAVVQGAMQITSGAISVGSGAATLVATANPKADFTTGSKFLTDLNAKQSIASGSGQMVTGLGSIISGGIEYSASLDDADAKRLEADGTAAQARRENAQEVAQNMADLIKDIREQLRAIVQSNIETNRGMARNI